MKWFQIKEQAAGTKRLIFLWHIYNILGKNAVKFIAFFVTFFAFLAAGNIRKCSAKFLRIAGIKPTAANQFRHFLSYSYSLIDKMEAFTDKFDVDKICYANEQIKNEFINDIKAGKGIFLLCSHLGNIEILRSFLNSEKISNPPHVNIFLSENQCKIFNNFLKSISAEPKVSTYAVEKIGVETSIELQEKLARGEITFLAGDRISLDGASTFTEKFLAHEAEFPKGAFKFAKLMSVPTYYICAIKNNDKYTIYLEKAPKNEKEMRKNYVKFLEKLTLKYPFQFYHFYDFFIE